MSDAGDHGIAFIRSYWYHHLAIISFRQLSPREALITVAARLLGP